MKEHNKTRDLRIVNAPVEVISQFKVLCAYHDISMNKKAIELIQAYIKKEMPKLHKDISE